MGFFISFEGCEGTGKTTQAERLRSRLARLGYQTALVREPGSTELGQYLRNWLRDENRGLPPEVELLLFAAARAALARETIRPLLAKDPQAVVIADRYMDSTTAYQGYGRRIGLDDVAVVNRLATGGIAPDVTILLDGPIADGLRRLGSAQLEMAMGQPGAGEARRIDGEGTRRFEAEPLEFHERVRRGYLRTAAANPERFAVVDAFRDVDEVADTIWDEVESRLRPNEAEASEAQALPLWLSEKAAVPVEVG